MLFERNGLAVGKGLQPAPPEGRLQEGRVWTMTAEKPAERNEERKKQLSEEMIEQLRIMASTVKFGSITLIIQDGKIVQIDKNEKIRFK